MQIKSTAFENNGNIPAKYTCDGENVNPPLEFSEVPQNAESLALVADDPDAPGKTWVHWTIWNINPKTKKIPEHAKLEKAIEGITDFGKPGYGGPCPPSGTHRYFFKLYALDTELNLDPSSDVGQLQEEIEGHVIEKAELIGKYSKS
ncbi:MAG: YbhB/YbcL family Raf kinase inhibitor-like protein [Candidatus Humimicrobiaceae bacterium]